MKKVLLVLVSVLFCFTALQATATLTFTEMGEKKVTISADGFNTTNLDKIIYLNGVEVERFKRRSAASQTKDLLLPVGVNKIFVQEGDNSSNTLTAKILGNWKGDLSITKIEISGFEIVQSCSATASAPSYLCVTAFAQDMLMITTEIASSKSSTYLLSESDTATGPGNTETARSHIGNTYVSLAPEGGTMILEAGKFYRIQIIEGSTGARYMTAHYLSLSDWAIIEKGIKNEEY